MRQRHLLDSSEPSIEETGGEEEVGEEREERNGDGTPKDQNIKAHSPGNEKWSPQAGKEQTITDRGLPEHSPSVSPSKERANPKAGRPPVPPASSKPVLHHSFDSAVSQGDEDGSNSNGVRLKPYRNRKANSCDTGVGHNSPRDLEKSSDRKPPVKKPRLPPKRHKSVDFPGHTGPEPGNGEAS
ncbi:hypothetical protein AALO_G00016770 [Alosa alosa]|uniref:Uncharacterized protein n=2 Tax=Alosa TaxID=34772 RepID=A0AAV6HL12_9TELE|nr:hypothetical protein AALO_G00016770 [Alosa alosa]